MCMGCGSKGGSVSGKQSGKQMPKSWGGMNMNSGKGAKNYSSATRGGTSFGTPKVKGNFGSRGK